MRESIIQPNPGLLDEELAQDLWHHSYLEAELKRESVRLRQIIEELKEQAFNLREAAKLALYDERTGLLNRGPMYRIMEKEIRLALRKPRNLTIMMVDIDELKPANTRWGRFPTNDALAHIGNLLRTKCRQTDAISPSRWGGDEFLLYLPETAPLGGLRAADRISKIIATNPYHHEGDDLSFDIPLTISIGLTSGRLTQEVLERYEIPEIRRMLCTQADIALSVTKEFGKGGIGVYLSRDEDKDICAIFNPAGENKVTVTLVQTTTESDGTLVHQTSSSYTSDNTDSAIKTIIDDSRFIDL